MTPCWLPDAQADLEMPGSFDAAVAGCTCVIHTASPVHLDVPSGRESEHLIAMAVHGVENVFSAVNKAPSVRRVVFTSSVGEAPLDACNKSNVRSLSCFTAPKPC